MTRGNAIADTVDLEAGSEPLRFMTCAGEVAALMRSHDWSTSPLGSPDGWPQSLRTVVSLMLNSSFPMFVAWGPGLGFLYNDAYREVLGAKHPAALGRGFEEVWSEIWPDIGPLVDAALGGEASYLENLPLLMNRKGFDEETWFTFSYSPIPDETGTVAGMFCACSETTAQVLNERLQAFRNRLDEALHPLADPGDIMQTAAEILGRHLGVDRAGYAEVDGDSKSFVVERDWSEGAMASFVGRHRLDDFGPDLIAAFRAGRAVAFADVLSEPLTTGEDVADAFEAITMRAAITVPLVKAGRFAAALYAHSRSPRRWTKEDEALVQDVAERTWAAVASARAEQELRANEHELQRLADNLPLLVSIVDRDMRYAFNNKAYQNWFGRTPEELKGRPVREVIGEAAYDLLKPQIDRAMGGERFTTEQTVPYRLGGIREMRADYVPRFDDNGAVDGYYAIVQDISESRRAEAALRWNERRLAFLDRLGVETSQLADADAILATTTRLLGEHLNLSVCAYADMDEDQDGFTIRGDWAAPGSTSIVGHYSLADFGKLAVRNLGAGLPLVVNDNLAELAPEEAETFQNIGITATICMPLVKEGRLTALMAIHDRVARIWSEEDLSLLREVTERSWAYVERVGAVAELRASEANLRAANDMLEQRVQERTHALQQSEKSIRTVFETSHQNQGLLTPDGKVVYLNKTALDSIDGRLEDLVGRDFWDTPFFTGTLGMPEIVRRAVERVADGGIAAVNMALTMPTGERIYDFSMRPVFDDDGAVVAIVPEAIETTLRVKAEEALRQSQKMEAVGQLTGGVAHDFNNLLMAVLGNLDLLRKHLAGDPRSMRLIEGAMKGAQRGAALTQRLLAFARRQDLKVEPTRLTDLVSGMADLLDRSLGSGIERRLILPAGSPPALVDANQVELAILNLVVNARDAMPDGGLLTIEVDVLAADSDLEPGDYVRLTVADTGQGMSTETLQKATEPFFSTKGVGKGTGLGLSMIHGLAVQLGGRLRLASAVGEGTRAELWLPVAQSTGSAATLAAPFVQEPSPMSDMRLRILAVDDDALIAMSTVDMLEDLGHEVFEANSGARALEILRGDTAIDLMITDFAMPKMNGTQLAVAARELRPGLPILLATGYAELPAGEELNLPKLGKPYGQDQLAAEIGKLLKQG